MATRGQNGPMNELAVVPGRRGSSKCLSPFSLRGAGRMLLGFAKLQRQKTLLKSDVATKLFHLYQECVLSEEDLQLKIKPLSGRNSHLLGREHQKNPE